MSCLTKDPHLIETIAMAKRISSLEVELRIEKEQHALAQQCINYMAKQLAINGCTSNTPIPSKCQSHGRRLERSVRRIEARVQPRGESQFEEREEREKGIEAGDQEYGDRNVESMPSSVVLPSNTALTPPNPGLDRTFKAKCLVPLHREDAKPQTTQHKPSSKEETLFTFEHSGSGTTHQEPPAFVKPNNPHSHAISQVRHAKKPEKPLSLESLADRYKDRRPTVDGINASQWAQQQKKSKRQEVQGDLIEFPEDEEQIIEVEGTKEPDLISGEPTETKAPKISTKTTNATEPKSLEGSAESLAEERINAAKQRHAAQLRRNQALVMYDPPPSVNALRTILVTHIPEILSLKDIIRTVTGGTIVKFQPMQTIALTGSKSMLITFLHADHARKFLDSVQQSTQPRFSLLNSPAYPVNGYLADDMVYKGITRCLAIHGLHESMKCEIFWAAVLRAGEHGFKHSGLIDVSKDEKGICHLEFVSVRAALAAKAEIRDRLSGWFSSIEHESDPCDREDSSSIDGKEMVEETSANMAEIVEEGELHEPAAHAEQESDAGAGAEVEEELLEIERDANGWPVGGLDYD